MTGFSLIFYLPMGSCVTPVGVGLCIHDWSESRASQLWVRAEVASQEVSLDSGGGPIRAERFTVEGDLKAGSLQTMEVLEALLEHLMNRYADLKKGNLKVWSI